MAEVTLKAGARTEFGKGAARRVRRAGLVPAVLYGHGSDPVHVTLPGHETLLALRQANVLLSITLPNGKPQLALPKQVQRDPIRDSIEHVDLLIVKRGEKVTVEVPLVLVGEAAADTLVNQDRIAVSVLAEATNIPAEITVPIEGLHVGTQITLADVVMPAGVTLAEDAEGLVLTVAKARSAADIDAELAEAAAEGDADAAQSDAADAD
ncbi:MAG: 50S ribosomal protein L25/general stress protein Ctc [Propionibacteriaceae bacterium]|nr:50S ribosomal protein L25/general stress protein Ctc [Propionibacteriaceae bacterium]